MLLLILLKVTASVIAFIFDESLMGCERKITKY